MWLHFILYKLLEQTVWPSALKPPPRKQKDAHARWKRANDLEHVLLRVQELLDPGVVCEEERGLKSASQLVGLALEEGWLDVGDVVGEEVVDAKVEGKEGERRLVEDMARLDLKLDSTDELAEGGTTVEPQRQRPRTRRKR
jgi:serine/threonine-protein kinase haspin